MIMSPSRSITYAFVQRSARFQPEHWFDDDGGGVESVNYSNYNSHKCSYHNLSRPPKLYDEKLFEINNYFPAHCLKC